MHAGCRNGGRRDMSVLARPLHAVVQPRLSLSVQLAVILVSELIWIGTAEQVVLLDTRKLSRLGWQTYPSDRNFIQGWKEASYRGSGHIYRVYFTCDVTKNEVNNWVRLPYIKRGKGNRLYVEVRFTVRKCTKYHNPENLQQCKESFKLLYYEADSDFGNSGMPTWDTLTYRHVDVIAADQTFTEKSNAVINTETRSVPVAKNGVYFAFYDQGTCATLISIKVYYIMCPRVTSKFATFPNTSAGTEVADIVQKMGSCVPNAVKGEQPKYLCGADGKWSFLEGQCVCTPGHEPRSDQACTACQPGSYKLEKGESECLPCPGNSHSDTESMAECGCDDGFYRSPTDNKSMPCTKPPSEPENVTVVYKDQTSVNVVWSTPQNLGGRADLSYRVECTPCDSSVSFFPKPSGFNTTSVLIQGLNPDTVYNITVISENGVTALSKQKIFTTIEVQTVPTALSKIEKVGVAKVGINYVTLWWKWVSQRDSSVIVYEVRWYPAYRTYSVHRDDTHQNNFTFSNLEPNTEYTFQVRGQTQTGWGEYSNKVSVKTRNNDPLPRPRMSDQEKDIRQQPIIIIAGGVVAVVICTAIVVIMVIMFLKREVIQTTFHIKRNNSEVNRKALSVTSHTISYSHKYGDMNFPGPPMEYPPTGKGTMRIPLFSPPGSLHTYIDPYTYEDPDQAVQEFTKEIDSAHITIETVIGGGEFGNVCKAWLQVPGQGQLCVAIKTLKTGASDKSRLDFLTEASIMGQFDDPNVIYLEGVVTKSHPIMIVTEFMENGSLDVYLRQNEDKFTVTQLTIMLRDIASGMRYLSDIGYVHRDLAARNILVSNTLVCKVADFGLSREVELDSPEGAYTTKGGKIPVKWTALEAIGYRKFTSASDVWSFGVVMWEVISHGEQPYWDWSNQDVIKVVEKGYRLPPPMECPEPVYRLMLDCWQHERLQRPKFSAIVKLLDKLIRTPELLTKQAKHRPYYNFVNPGLPYISSSTSIQDCLFSLTMERYIENFLRAGYTDIHQVAPLNLGDLTRLGITLVGHQKKLINGIQSQQADLDDKSSKEMIV